MRSYGFAGCERAARPLFFFVKAGWLRPVFGGGFHMFTSTRHDHAPGGKRVQDGHKQRKLIETNTEVVRPVRHTIHTTNHSRLPTIDTPRYQTTSPETEMLLDTRAPSFFYHAFRSTNLRLKAVDMISCYLMACLLPLAPQRCVQPSKVGQGRGVREAIQHLAHSGLGGRLLVPPVAGG